jgi:hypothetical protein
MKKIIISLFYVLFIISFLNAENVSLSSEVNKKTVALDDNIVLTVTVSGDAKDIPQPNIPQIDGFTIYSSGRSQNISIINGKVSSSLTYNYVLNPKSIGKYSIGAITVNYKGQNYSTQPIQVEVTTAGTQSTLSQNSGTGTANTSNAKSVFVTTSVDKNNVYVNEPITLTFRFYSRVNLLSNPGYSPPSLVGFFAEDLPPQKNFVEAYKGVNYRVSEIKTALFPASSGKYTIGPAQVECNIQDFSNDDADDFFSGFFAQGKSVRLQSDPIIINVKPLPDSGKPNSFNSSVGNYSMNVSVDKKNIELGDVIDLIIEIKGEGNIKSISEPILKDISNFKKYDTIASLNISKDGYKVRGSKVFKIVLMPKVSGKLSLPNVEFSFFDINTKTYKKLYSPQITVNVKPNSKSNTAVYSSANINEPEKIKLISTDIRFIKDKTCLCFGNPIILKKWWYIFILLLFPVLYLCIIGWNFYKSSIQRNNVGYRRKIALKNSLSKINSILKLLDKQSFDKTYVQQALFYALSEYLGNKFNLSPSGLMLKEVLDMLDKYSCDENIKKQIQEIWDEIDFIRFAPSLADINVIKQTALKLKNNISNWDKNIDNGLVYKH